MPPAEQADDVVDRQPDGCSKRTSIRSHIGAFQNDGADVRRLGEQAAPGVDDVSLGLLDVEGGQVVLNDACELLSAFDAFDRQIGRCADPNEMRGGQLGAVDG